MTKDKEVEAKEYINVINKSTESVGFAIRGPIVIGYYCPPATSYNADELKLSVPKVRKAPAPPKVPEGVKMLDNTDAECKVLTETEGDEQAVREKCSEGNCCGATKLGEKVFKETCRDSTKTEFIDDETTYTFACYEDARRIVMSLSAIAVSVAFYV